MAKMGRELAAKGVDVISLSFGEPDFHTPRAFSHWEPLIGGRYPSVVTFWIFWDNGYEALQSLDDNQDGKLEGDELKGLAIWQDRNCDGISDADLVMQNAHH